MEYDIVLINKLLELENNSPIGLAEGKMGVCIYFFIVGREKNNIKYIKHAENMLDNIFNNIDKIHSVDILNGYTGIGLGVDYLISNNYVKGNINEVLGDIDSYICKCLGYEKNYDKLPSLFMLHLLFYICKRLENVSIDKHLRIIFQELAINIINYSCTKFTQDTLNEPLAFNLSYMLPQLLYVLSKLHSLSFYNYKINKIVEELSYSVLTLIPRLHSNRLYLAWGVSCLEKLVDDQNWTNHLNILKREIDLYQIINNEIKDCNSSFYNGYAGILYLVEQLGESFFNANIKNWKVELLKKIEFSDIWGHYLNNSKFFNNNIGLFNGFCGISIAYLCLKRQLIKKI